MYLLIFFYRQRLPLWPDYNFKARYCAGVRSQRFQWLPGCLGGWPGWMGLWGVQRNHNWINDKGFAFFGKALFCHPIQVVYSYITVIYEKQV